MGCDIHVYKEKFVDGKWLTADVWEEEDYGDGEIHKNVPWGERFTERNYNLFGVLSKGVRRHFDFGFEQRGIPFDACDEVAEQAENWDCDGHSHSYLYLHELKAMRDYLKTRTLPISGMKDKDELVALYASIKSGEPDWNLLYPFCQDTNASNYVDFAIDVPADFIVGNGFDKLIQQFDNVEGENHRIVFFFDN